MKTRLHACFLPILLSLVLLSGCLGTNGQTQAITDAIVSYSDYYIEVRNLDEQVKAQARTSDTNSQTQDYSILTDIPDYTAIDLCSVNVTLPDPALSSGSAVAYQKKAALAMRQALEQYALDNTFPSYVQIPVTFTVTKDQNAWSANISSQSKLDIQQTVEGLVSRALESSAEYQTNYRMMKISSSLQNLLKDAFGSAEYAQTLSIQSFIQTEDGNYSLVISYPDPQSVFSALGTAYEASFNQPFYGDALTVSLSTEDIRDLDLSGVSQQSATVLISYDEASGESVLLDDGGLAANLSSVKSQMEVAVSQMVNDTWRVAPLETPSSGSILEGESAGNPIKFKANADLGKYFYVRFYAISGENISEEGTLALGVFIKGGKSATFDLPTGYYRVACQTGSSWYGLEHLFGSDSKTYNGGSAVRSRAGYQNTISFE